MPSGESRVSQSVQRRRAFEAFNLSVCKNQAVLSVKQGNFLYLYCRKRTAERVDSIHVWEYGDIYEKQENNTPLYCKYTVNLSEASFAELSAELEECLTGYQIKDFTFHSGWETEDGFIPLARLPK